MGNKAQQESQGAEHKTFIRTTSISEKNTWKILNVTHVTVCCNICAGGGEEEKMKQSALMYIFFALISYHWQSAVYCDSFVAGNHNVVIFTNNGSYNRYLSCHGRAANSAYYTDVTQIAEVIALTWKIPCMHSFRTKISTIRTHIRSGCQTFLSTDSEI